jgi:hypothetical protein
VSDLAEFAAEDDSKAALNRALRALTKARASKDELVTAVHEAAMDACSALSFPPVPKPALTKSTRDAEIAVVELSDWQLAKRTVSYSSDVCEERIVRLGEKVVSLTDLQRSNHPVREVRVHLLGDLVEGELIFPGQAHLIDASLYAQVLVDGPRILGGFLRTLAASFEKVHVTGVIGNHGSLGGRARKDYHPESNADAMMYEVTRIALKDEPRITWASNVTSGERLWYAVDVVGEHRFFLFHGDQVKGGSLGFPWYGFGKKLSGWSNLYDFDYAVSGHFHTPVRGLYAAGAVTHWGNGSTESDNTYAAENLAASGFPCQWLLFVHPKRGVTAEYLCRL